MKKFLGFIFEMAKLLATFGAMGVGVVLMELIIDKGGEWLKNRKEEKVEKAQEE